MVEMIQDLLEYEGVVETGGRRGIFWIYYVRQALSHKVTPPLLVRDFVASAFALFPPTDLEHSWIDL